MLPSDRTPLERVAYCPSSLCREPHVSSSSWSAAAINTVFAGTTRTGNHVCRPDVCHKGKIGRKGFCRMYYWHWCRGKDKQGKDIARMAHGHSLQGRWNGSGSPPVCTSPPFLGLPALELNHPFHFKMSPAMMLGPQCNHDIAVLLRMGRNATLQEFPKNATSKDTRGRYSGSPARTRKRQNKQAHAAPGARPPKKETNNNIV